MNASAKLSTNVKQVVPFFRVADMVRSVRFYAGGLGFTVQHKWVVDEKVRWCWLELGGAALMLQEYLKHSPLAAAGTLGAGVSLAFQCEDAVALYREFMSRGIEASEPQVGNSMWVTCLADPDGYCLEFASLTDTPEETKLSELQK